MGPSESQQNQSLTSRLRERIRREGPITFRDWMEAALYDSTEGYYCRTDLVRWGRTGDYRTSPELSPLFAATFARYFSTLYDELHSPDSFTLIEAGAGAGHFAEGVLETLAADYPRAFAATRYLIDEQSPHALTLAQSRLSRFADRIEFRRLSEITSPLDNVVIFANELFDALPVHRLKMSGGRLSELCVAEAETGSFTWVERPLTSTRLIAYLERSGIHLAEGQEAEVNLAALDWIERAAAILRRGFLITIDYGAEAAELYDPNTRPHGTLRAFHHHQLTDDVLALPGQQDLTTTIDWTAIKKHGTQAGLHTITFERQDKFLLRAGLLQQLELLASRASSEAELATLRASARHLILPDHMSASFQVLVQEH